MRQREAPALRQTRWDEAVLLLPYDQNLQVQEVLRCALDRLQDNRELRISVACGSHAQAILSAASACEVPVRRLEYSLAEKWSLRNSPNVGQKEDIQVQHTGHVHSLRESLKKLEAREASSFSLVSPQSAASKALTIGWLENALRTLQLSQELLPYVQQSTSSSVTEDLTAIQQAASLRQRQERELIAQNKQLAKLIDAEASAHDLKMGECQQQRRALSQALKRAQDEEQRLAALHRAEVTAVRDAQNCQHNLDMAATWRECADVSRHIELEEKGHQLAMKHMQAGQQGSLKDTLLWKAQLATDGRELDRQLQDCASRTESDSATLKELERDLARELRWKGLHEAQELAATARQVLRCHAARILQHFWRRRLQNKLAAAESGAKGAKGKGKKGVKKGAKAAAGGKKAAAGKKAVKKK